MIASCLTTLSLYSMPAAADKRKPAPIVYATPGASAAETQMPKTVSTVQTRDALPREAYIPQTRTAAGGAPSFHYPDPSEMRYGAGERAPGLKSIASLSPAQRYKETETVPIPVQARPIDLRSVVSEVEDKRTVLDVSQNTRQSSVHQSAVTGTVFQPVTHKVYDERGQASVFHPALIGQSTANGEILDNTAMIAAHPSLPLPSLVQVINLENNKEVVVRVNDRGPFDKTGLIEVSARVADLLGFSDTGTADVRVRYLGPAPAAQSTPEAVPPTPKPVLQAKASLRPVPPASKPVLQAELRPDPASQKSVTTAPTPQHASHAVSVSAMPPLKNVVSKPFLVQLASFIDISNAERLHTSLTRDGTHVEIVPARVNGTDYFRVIAGPVDGRRAAESLRDRLAHQGIGPGLVIAAP